MSLPNNDYGFEPEEEQNKYGFEPEEEPSWVDNLETESLGQKQIASAVAHGLGAAAALPGNIRDLAYATGEKAKALRQSVYDKLGIKWNDDFLKNGSLQQWDESIKAPFSFIADKIPNSQDVNEFIDSLAGGALAPKSETQKLVNDTAEDIVNSALHMGPLSFVRNFIIPVGANVLKKGAELFGVSPSSSEVLKMVSWIGADMASISNPRQMLSNGFSQNRRMIPQGDNIPVRPRDLQFLDQVERDMTSGGTRPSTAAALTKVREMRDAMQTGQVPARQVLDFYRSKNELMSNFGAFNVEGAAKPEHVYRLRQVQQLTNNMLNRYGRTQNPQFLQSFRDNNLAWSSLMASDNVAAYIKKNYTKPLVSDIAKGFFMQHGGKSIVIAGGLTALERLQSLARRLENPVLRRYYGDVLGNSLQRNRAPMINSLQKLDAEAKKIEDKEKSSVR